MSAKNHSYSKDILAAKECIHNISSLLETALADVSHNNTNLTEAITALHSIMQNARYAINYLDIERNTRNNTNEVKYYHG